MDNNTSGLKEQTKIDIEELRWISDIQNVGTCPKKLKWSDEVLKNIANTTFIPQSIADLTKQAEIANRFLHFYETGNVPNTCAEVDIVIAMASIIYKDKANDLIWKKEDYAETGSKEPCYFIDGLEPLDEADKDKYSRNGPQHGQDPLRKFVDKCANILKEYPVTSGSHRLTMHLLRVLNFLALTMLRCIVKTFAEMKTHFSDLETNIRNLLFGAIARSYAPPTMNCIAALENISKNDPAVKSFMAKLIILWRDEHDKNPNISRVIGNAVLTEIRWSGMGILQLIFDICCHYSANWKRLMDLTLISKTLSSWNQISIFYKQYLTIGAEDKTICWAGVVLGFEYFMNFTFQRHLTLTSLLFEPAIVAADKQDIQYSEWAKDHCRRISYYRSASLWLETNLSGVTAGNSTDNELAKIINQTNVNKSS